MNKLINELPEEIKKIALKRRCAEKEDLLISAFSWDDTPEGHKVWENVNRGDYQSFYNFYDFYTIKEENKQQLTPEEWCKEKGYNEYHIMIIEQYLNDIQ